jgi:hypothetical protein
MTWLPSQLLTKRGGPPFMRPESHGRIGKGLSSRYATLKKSLFDA